MQAAAPYRPRSRGLLHPANRVRPLQAWRSMRALLADPEATGEVFKIIEALKGGSLARAIERLGATADGRSMLQRLPSLLPSLEDRRALAALPEGSLGRAYLAFVEAQQLSADGLVAASEEAPRGEHLDDEERWMGNRLRDIHDLQHVLTGYGRDELGELCLLAFMTTQTHNRGIEFIVFMGRRRYRNALPQLDVDALVSEGRDLARAAAWLPAVPWEDRLGEPLETLRSRLGLRAPVRYLAARAEIERAGS
jgi:ubiquinone biosynthesis protein COQ4